MRPTPSTASETATSPETLRASLEQPNLPVGDTRANEAQTAASDGHAVCADPPAVAGAQVLPGPSGCDPGRIEELTS